MKQIDMLKFIFYQIKSKCLFTYIHSLKVSMYAAQLATVVLPNRPEQIKNIEMAALLHDVGKIIIDNALLQKKGSLTSDEYEEMKRHANYGYEYLKATIAFAQYANIVKHHHERWDGSGYPDHLIGYRIPLESRIICVADSFDAMTNKRPYTKALSVEESLNEIKKNSGSQFDPTLSNQFIGIFGGK